MVLKLSTSVYIRFLYQELGLRGKKLQEKLIEKGFPRIPPRTLLRHAKKPAFDETEDLRKRNPGRPRKLKERDLRNIKQKLGKLRESGSPFCSKQIQEECGISPATVSNRTLRRRLNDMEFFYLQSRKKGLLSKGDLTKRLAFARAHVKKPASFWQHQIAFYLDGTGWAHKTNPADHAVTLRSRTWRKKSEGCKIGCTAKGKKEGVGGKVANFMVAISYGKGVIAAVPYEGHINGEKFADIIANSFPQMLSAAQKGDIKLFVQDGDKSQNSKVALEQLEVIGASVFAIPARSPDLNPIENVFHLSGKKIKLDGLALNIQHESFEQFQQRCQSTLMSFSSDIIDRTISSMPKRLLEVIKGRGNRTKY